MDGIIQLIIGAVLLYISFGVIKEIAKTAFYLVAIGAVIILLWGAADLMGIDLGGIFKALTSYC